VKDHELLAIVAAIIFAGADDSEKAAGYTIEGAVKRARAIVREAIAPEKAEVASD
jgi:hypothetical protein